MPLIIFEIPGVKKKYNINRFSLLIGSLFPDFIDKPLELLGFGSANEYAHTLLSVFAFFLVLHLASKRNTSISIPFLVGMLFHLLLDVEHAPIFFPFISYDIEKIEDPVKFWSEAPFIKPYIFLTELIGIIVVLFVITKNKLYSFKEIVNYLKIKPQSNNSNEINSKRSG